MSDVVKSADIEWYVIQRVKELREKKGFSQEAFADRLGCSSGYIGQVESKKFRAKYNLKRLNDIARVLDCSPKDFLPEDPL